LTKIIDLSLIKVLTVFKNCVLLLSVIKHLEVKAMADIKGDSVQIKGNKSETFEAIVKFKEIARDTKQDFGTLFIAMLNAYQSAQNQNGFDLTVDEELEVMEAVATGVTRSELLKTGLLAQSRKVKSQAGKLEALKASIAGGQDNVSTTIKGSADLRIDRAVRSVFAHNDCQSDIGNQWFITATAIQKMTNCNMPAIKAYMSSNQSQIDSHHNKHGLTPDTNRGRKGRSIMEEVVV
jgi:hypothetical protein